MSNEPSATSVKEISSWIRDAAASKSWRPGHPLGGVGSFPENCDLHVESVRSSLHRARLKTFVRMAKPFRGIFRDQGAVNNSLIEAVHHLAIQNQEITKELTDLRGVVRTLRTQLRRALPSGTTAALRSGEAPEISAKVEGRSPETSDDSVPAPDRNA